MDEGEGEDGGKVASADAGIAPGSHFHSTIASATIAGTFFATILFPFRKDSHFFYKDSYFFTDWLFPKDSHFD